MRACPILRHLETTRNAIERGLHGRLPLRLSSLAMPRWKVSVLCRGWVGGGAGGWQSGWVGVKVVVVLVGLAAVWEGEGGGGVAGEMFGRWWWGHEIVGRWVIVLDMLMI